MKKKSNTILVNFKDNSVKDIIKNSIYQKHKPKIFDLVKHLKHSQTEIIQLHESDNIHAIVDDLHKHEHINYAQPDYSLTLCKQPQSVKSFDKQWGLANNGQEDEWGTKGKSHVDIDIEKAWQITLGSSNITVAVIDSGIDLEHISLKNNISNQSQVSETTSQYPYNWSFTHNTLECTKKDLNHGTLVSGILAANQNNGNIVGVAPNVKILPLRIMSNETCLTSNAIEAIEYAKLHNVKLVNCSWGGNDHNPALLHHIKNSNMLFVCAAGNQGNCTDTSPFYPACFDLPNIISVTAVNNDGELWVLSNYGKDIDVVAPGTGIYSSVSSDSNDSYGYDSGTSLATPFVTGIAALIISNNINLSPADIKHRIISTCSKLPNLDTKVCKNGLVNAFYALSKE